MEYIFPKRKKTLPNEKKRVVRKGRRVERAKNLARREHRRLRSLSRKKKVRPLRIHLTKQRRMERKKVPADVVCGYIKLSNNFVGGHGLIRSSSIALERHPVRLESRGGPRATRKSL